MKAKEMAELLLRLAAEHPEADVRIYTNVGYLCVPHDPSVVWATESEEHGLELRGGYYSREEDARESAEEFGRDCHVVKYIMIDHV